MAAACIEDHIRTKSSHSDCCSGSALASSESDAQCAGAEGCAPRLSGLWQRPVRPRGACAVAPINTQINRSCRLQVAPDSQQQEAFRDEQVMRNIAAQMQQLDHRSLCCLTRRSLGQKAPSATKGAVLAFIVDLCISSKGCEPGKRAREAQARLQGPRPMGSAAVPPLPPRGLLQRRCRHRGVAGCARLPTVLALPHSPSACRQDRDGVYLSMMSSHGSRPGLFERAASSQLEQRPPEHLPSGARFLGDSLTKRILFLAG